MAEIIKTTRIDRKREISIAFAKWLHDFYVPVSNYGYVQKTPKNRNTIVMFLGDLYDEFLKKAWK